MMTKQEEIITELGVKPVIDPEEEIAKRIGALHDYLAVSHLGGYVLGISGGQDSLLAGTLAQKAVEKLRKEGHDASFHTVLLPYGVQADAADARLAVDFIHPDYTHDWNIKGPTDAFVDMFEQAEGRRVTDFNKGNLKARARMASQYLLSGTDNVMVVGTDHASEAITGFFTKYGDGAADITPLATLTKDQGTELLMALGAPARLYLKQPTADLLDNQPGRTDEDELGVTYRDINAYLKGKTIDPAAAARIEQLYDQTQHKRRPPVRI